MNYGGFRQWPIRPVLIICLVAGLIVDLQIVRFDCSHEINLTRSIGSKAHASKSGNPINDNTRIQKTIQLREFGLRNDSRIFSMIKNKQRSAIILDFCFIIMACTRFALSARTFAGSFVGVVFWLKSLLLSFCKSTVEINTEACCMSRQSRHSQCCGLLSERRCREDRAARNSYRKVDKHTAADPRLVPLRPFVLASFFPSQYPVKIDRSDTDTVGWALHIYKYFEEHFSLQHGPIWLTQLWPLWWNLAFNTDSFQLIFYKSKKSLNKYMHQLLNNNRCVLLQIYFILLQLYWVVLLFASTECTTVICDMALWSKIFIK